MSEAAVIARGTMNGDPSPTGSVLIIDDEAEIRESLQTLLEMEGFEVETAVTGEDGLSQMADHPFDLVLLDLTLPGRNGMETLCRLCSRWKGSKSRPQSPGKTASRKWRTTRLIWCCSI